MYASQQTVLYVLDRDGWATLELLEHKLEAIE